MAHRYRLYLETAFWDRLGDRSYLERRRVTYRFLNRACLRQEILISPLVIEEVLQTPDPEERTVIQRQLRRARPVVVSGTQRSAAIARALRVEGGFGERVLADLTHVAYAVMGAADALVTWDQRTLARDAVRNAVHVYCRREGMEAPLIGTPEEVAQWLELKM